MSAELEVLDQLLGGKLPLTLIRQIFDDEGRFVRATLAMLESGEIRLLEPDGSATPAWQWADVVAEVSPLSGGERHYVELTDAGAKRIA